MPEKVEAWNVKTRAMEVMVNPQLHLVITTSEKCKKGAATGEKYERETYILKSVSTGADKTKLSSIVGKVKAMSGVYGKVVGTTRKVGKPCSERKKRKTAASPAKKKAGGKKKVASPKTKKVVSPKKTKSGRVIKMAEAYEEKIKKASPKRKTTKKTTKKTATKKSPATKKTATKKTATKKSPAKTKRTKKTLPAEHPIRKSARAHTTMA